MLKISKEEYYDRLCGILESLGIEAVDRKDFRYFVQFVVRMSGGDCMVKIFQGKKGTHAQILNNRGDAEKTVRGAIERMMGVLPFSEGEKAKASAPDGHAITAPLVGTDESGKGDFFGPLVVAAVYVTPEGAAELTAAGVRDCKTMTDRSVMTAAGHIERSTVSAVVTLNPERYNTLYEETGNLNKLLAWCHAHAIEDILKKVDCDLVLTDQFGNKSLVEDALARKGVEVTLEQRPRAESNIAVAAASVLARAKFVESLREMSDEYGTNLPKGASAKVDAAARDFVRAFGRAELHKVAKMHFKNASRI